MIPIHILLPTLNAADRAEFQQLCADHAKANAQITAHNNEARVARKHELKAKLNTAPADQLLSIGAELESLDTAYSVAKRGAKAQLRGLAPRYGPLFERLFKLCDKHTDDLAQRATKEWSKHLAQFEITQCSPSPVVQALQEWKRSLSEKREQLALVVSNGVTPPHPTTFLPFSVR